MDVKNDIILRRLKEKRARYLSHEEFLTTCIRNNVIPTGFELKWTNNMEMADEIKDKCLKVKQDASIKLMELTLEACKIKLSDLNDNICAKEKLVSEHIIKETDANENHEKRRLRKIKDGKLSKNYENTKEVKVAGDGNCFYRCLSVYFHGEPSKHKEIRKDIVSFMNLNSQRFQQFTDKEIDVHLHDQTFTDGRVESWATEAEVMAASALYELNIKVKVKYQGRYNWNVHTYRLSHDSQFSIPYDKTIHLQYNSNHYNLLLHEQRNKTTLPTGTVREGIDWFDLTQDNVPQDSATSEESNNEIQPKPSKIYGTSTKNRNEKNDKTTRKLNEGNPKYFRRKWINSRVGVKHSNGTRVQCEKNEKMDEMNINSEGNDVNATSNDKDKITNLSSYPLNKSEISLLEKGLKFVPDRTKINMTKLLSDLTEWERRMRLREFFFEENSKKENIADEEKDNKFKVKAKSAFTPKTGRDQWLDMYIELVKNDVINNIGRSGKLNTTRDERDAFFSLLQNPKIVIRPADKGSGIVILDKDDYLKKLHSEMEQSKSYEETDADMIDETMKRIRKLVNKMHKEGVISNELKQYLIPRYPTPGKLKGNPKLHKNNAPLRTIVSGIDTPTEKFAEVAEHELNDFVINSPTYIRDTTDFISKLKNIDFQIPNNAILFCFDVCKLYPSVPRLEGIEACKEAFNQRTNPLIPTEYAIKMIETVLDFNSFKLGDKNYKQIEGVAIGSKLGRNFACAYMRKWDEQLLTYEQNPLFYKRYIDDGFGIWGGDLKSLLRFVDHANNIHENIKIELRWSRQSIEFLDTLVKIDNGRVYTDLYTKPTDKHLYLRADSCHPPHTKKALAYGLGLRLRRICDKDEDYHRHRRDLKLQLRKRGYSSKHIEKQLNRIDRLDKNDLLQRTDTKRKEDRIPLVLTYSKLLPDVNNILKKHQSTLHKSERMSKVFPIQPIIAFRRDSNLCDTLVHKKTNNSLKQNDKVCGCSLCLTIRRDSISDSRNRKSFPVLADSKCTDRNLIYALICNKCDLTVYVGETERTLKERVEEHRRDIKYQRDKPIMKHFKNHSERDLHVAVMSKTAGENKAYRLIVEEHWIKNLETRTPQGCNIKTN